MKKALVTGGTGFIGKRLCNFLKDSGYQVNILGRPLGKPSETSSIPGGVDFYAYDGSLSSIDHCLSMVRPDCIFHLATRYIRNHKPDDVPDLFQANVLFPALLLESMSSHDVKRVVMAGSFWQFEDGLNHSPVNLYASTKQSSEAVARYYADKQNLDIRFLYIADTYGPADPRDKLIANIYRSVFHGKPIQIKAPRALMDLLHVDDVARAFLQCANLPVGKSERWRIQSHSTIMVADLVAKIKTLLPTAYKSLISVADSLEPPPPLPTPAFAPLLPNWHQEILIESGLASVFDSLDG